MAIENQRKNVALSVRLALVLRFGRPYNLNMSITLFKASQLAAWCGVDLKSIHNWVNSGKITAGRTPGRHLRFTAETVRDVLIGMGVPVPKEVTDALIVPEQAAAS